ncbi:unnamed protein product, partial [Amoebophrya sp. A25]|eukprot:GSA25T00007963001.1
MGERCGNRRPDCLRVVSAAVRSQRSRRGAFPPARGVVSAALLRGGCGRVATCLAGARQRGSLVCVAFPGKCRDLVALSSPAG